MSIDSDEIQEWLRHPVTKFLLHELSSTDPNLRYRNATDVLSLGQAQGFDEALRLMGRLLGQPNGLSFEHKKVT